VAGLLPDTLDFKFWRFFYRHDIEIAPDPLRPDAQMIADAVAAAIHRAYETGRPVNVKLDTIRMGADLWQQYEVKFDVPGQGVRVNYGPIVDTGGNPVRRGSDGKETNATAPLVCGIQLDYEATTIVQGFEGPLFRMEPTADKRVKPQIIPWHRQWSHSVVTAVLFALACSAMGHIMAGVIALVGGARMCWSISSDSWAATGSFHSGKSARLDSAGCIRTRRCRISWGSGCRACSSSESVSRRSRVDLPFQPFETAVYGALIPVGMLALLRRIPGRRAAQAE